MKLGIVRPTLLCICLLCLVGFSIPAFADGSHERVQFGRDVIVEQGEEVSQVTCFGCSVRVRGHVATEVTTFGGGIVVEDEGSIGSDATSFGGNVRLEKTGKVGGDLTVFGGRIHRDPESAIGGDVTSFSGGFWFPLMILLPLLVLGGFAALIVWLIRRLTRPNVPATA